MNVLIAGYGDLGQAVVRYMRAHPLFGEAEIYALRRSAFSTIDTALRPLQADLRDEASISSALSDTPAIDILIYCPAPSERTREAYRDTYLNGLKNLVGVIGTRQEKLPRILFVSSTAVYASDLDGLVTETSPTYPRGFNGQILLDAEQWLMRIAPFSLILRLSGIYGPDRLALLRSIQAGTASLPSDSGYWANRIHIDDAARAILHLLASSQTGVFIGTDSTPYPIDELYASLAQALEAPLPQPGPPSPMMGKKRLSNAKLLGTGFKFLWPDSRQGYQRIIEQYRLGSQS